MHMFPSSVISEYHLLPSHGVGAGVAGSEVGEGVTIPSPDSVGDEVMIEGDGVTNPSPDSVGDGVMIVGDGVMIASVGASVLDAAVGDSVGASEGLQMSNTLQFSTSSNVAVQHSSEVSNMSASSIVVSEYPLVHLVLSLITSE